MVDDAAALAWRLDRQGLGVMGAGSVTDAVDRVVAVRGWPAELTEQAVGVRCTTPEPGALARALESGELIRSYAFRGGSYAFTPAVGAVLLAMRTTSRGWEKRRFQQQGGFTLDDWQPFREMVRGALADGPLTREEITAEVARIPSLAHLTAGAAGAGADGLYKPLHWWGDICFGPSRDGRATFRLLADDPQWPGLPEIDDAGHRAIRLYLAAYGPATIANLDQWLVEGLSVPRRRLREWLADLGDEVCTVTTDDGDEAYLLTADRDGLESHEAHDTVRLLPGFDPWVLGPGTADTRVVAPDHRAVASRGAHLVIRGGVLSGTWRIRRDAVEVHWFGTGRPTPHPPLTDEVRRLSRLRGTDHPLELVVTDS